MKYSKNIFVVFLLLAFTFSCKSKKNTETNQGLKKPNIIVLLVDDAGYADFGFMGCKDLKTPNIDKLAEKGVKFTDAHVSASVCGPSRAGLITGRYQQRFGFECNPTDPFTGLEPSESTIANAMKSQGYITAAFGKWHLGDDPGLHPNDRGFDYFWGFLAGSRNYFPDDPNKEPSKTHAIRENDKFTTFEGYLTDVLGEKCVDFIDKNKEKPFFIYWAPNAVHTPMQATEEDLKLFEGHPRQTLAAMTWALDRAVGNIVDKLEKEGLLNNTLIFFLSDNGGAHNNQSSNLPLKGFKGNEFEGGHRVPYFVVWPDKFQGSRSFDGLSSSLDIYATALDAAGGEAPKEKPLDGVSLLPFLEGKQSGNPHNALFWRKDKMAASRDVDFKMIRVEQLGYRLYNLKEDLGETVALENQIPEQLEKMKTNIQAWESELEKPRWTEDPRWDTVTWMIHEDYFFNREPDVRDLQQLKEYNASKKQK